MDRTVSHFASLGLYVNVNKTKVLIFNPSNWGPSKFQNMNSFINNSLLEKCDTYTNLGFVFKPSGSVIAGMNELLTKLKRAYHSISNILYENRKMKVDNALDLFDMTVTPVALYAVEHWGILSLPAASFKSKEAIIRTWESFLPETVNKKVCRLLLSCQRKSSRLLILGELGRYPLIIKSLVQTVKYKWSQLNSNRGCNTLVSEALSEMDNLGIDNWLYRVQQVEKLFNLSIHPRFKTADSVGKYVKPKLQSQFDLY